MMGQGEDFAIAQRCGKGGMTGGACGAFHAQPRAQVDLDADDFQRHVQRCADAPAVCRPGIGVRMQAVVHVQRTQAAAADAGIRSEQLQ